MALTITKADVVLLPAPELAARADLTDPIWDILIEWAGAEIGSNLGSQANQDRCGRYLVAHLATLWPVQASAGAGGMGGLMGSGGPVTGVTVGAVSRTNAVAEGWSKLSVSAAALATTAYGREFLRLIRLFGGPAVGLAS